MMRRRLCLALTALALLAAAATVTSYASYAKWASSPVTFYVNPTTPDLSPAAVIAATQFALDVWNTQGGTPFRFQYGGTASDTVNAYDNRNVVVFRNASNGSSIATTYSWWDSSKRLLDSDVVVWDAGFTFFTGTSGCGGVNNAAYLEDILTHEFGHALGLDHSSVADATMYPSYSYCSQALRTLAADDIAGVQSLYGVGSGPAPSPAPDPAPAPTPAPGNNTAPSLSITSPSNGATFAVGTQVTLAASAVDAEDGNLSYRTTWTDNGVSIGGGGLLSWVFATAGTHTITAKVNDNWGAVTTASVTITIGSSAPAPAPAPAPGPTSGNTAPSLSITSPGNGASFPVGSAVTLSASAIDAEDGNLSYRTTWTDNGVSIGGGSAFSVVFNAAGTHTIGARVNDNWGAVSTASVTITVGSASPPPAPAPAPTSGNTPPVVSITSPGNGAVVAAGSAVTLSASAIDAEDGNLSYRTKWTANGVPFGGGSSFVWSFTPGTYTIRAEVNDNWGVVVSASVTLYVQ